MEQGQAKLPNSRGNRQPQSWQSKILNEIPTPAIAWPTIALGVANLFVYLAVLGLAVAAYIPLLLAAAINVLCAYVCYTPLHEAVHSNVASRDRDWVNIAVGMLGAIPLLHNVRLHRTTHLAHHAHLNDPERDADHWVAGANPVSVLLRCGTLIYSHYAMGIRRARVTAGGKQKLRLAAVENVITLLPFAFVAVLKSFPTALVLVLGPALIGQLILGYLFDYLVHAPHDTADTAMGTRAFVAPGWTNRLLTFAYLSQNYHVVHHLRPSLPFYLYRKSFDRAEPELASIGTPVVYLGRVTQTG